MIPCQALVNVAEIVQDRNPCQETVESLTEAMDVIDCCLKLERRDLVPHLVQVVESFPLGRQGDVAKRLAIQKKQLAGKLPIMETKRRPLNWLIRGWNFADAIAKWAGTGFKMRSKREIAERLAICQACPELVDNVCQKCGCPCTGDADVVQKLSIKGQVCPIGKWN